jgi:hypothetical protein
VDRETDLKTLIATIDAVTNPAARWQRLTAPTAGVPD